VWLRSKLKFFTLHAETEQRLLVARANERQAHTKETYGGADVMAARRVEAKLR